MFDRLTYRQKLMAIGGLFVLMCLLVYSAAIQNTLDLSAANSELEMQIQNLQQTARSGGQNPRGQETNWTTSKSMEDAQGHFFETFDQFVNQGGKMDIVAMPMAQKTASENGLQSFVMSVEVESSFGEALEFIDHCDGNLEVLKLHSMNLQRITDRRTKRSRLITKLTFSGVLSTNQT